MMRQLWKLVKQGDLLEHEKAVLGQALEVSVVEPELQIILQYPCPNLKIFLERRTS